MYSFMKYVQNNHHTCLFGPTCLFGTREYKSNLTKNQEPLHSQDYELKKYTYIFAFKESHGNKNWILSSTLA